MFDEGVSTFKIGGISFNLGNCLSGLIAAILVCLLMIWLSRDLSLKPGKKQNFLEWLMTFTNKIVQASVPDSDGNKYKLIIFVLFVFIFISNQLGLAFQFVVGNVTYIKSPTAAPMATLTLSLMVLVISNAVGVKKYGFQGYLKNSFFSPLPILFPIKFLEQFTNFITLALRLYGNIYAGEVLLKLILEFAKSHGIFTFIPAIPLEMIWQGFSVFIGSIQAYVFTTLTMVYISQKIKKE